MPKKTNKKAESSEEEEVPSNLESESDEGKLGPLDDDGMESGEMDLDDELVDDDEEAEEEPELSGEAQEADVKSTGGAEEDGSEEAGEEN